MTPEQKAAFVIAQTQMMVNEREIMIAGNEERRLHGLSPAHGPDQWEDFLQKWEPVLGYNALIGFFRD